MTVIELGDVSSGATAPDGPTRAAGTLPGLPRYLLAVLAVFILLLVSGSVRPQPHGLRTLWQMPYHGLSFTVSDSSVYATDSLDGWHLRAFDLRSGAPRWRVDVPVESADLRPIEAAGALLIPIQDESGGEILDGADDGDDGPGTRDTRAVDTRTGATRWQQPGEVAVVAGDTVLLTQWNYRTARLDWIRSVRADDGSTVWLSRRPDMVTVTPVGPDDQHPEQIVTATSTGLLDVLRFTDGTAVASRRVPWLYASETGGDSDGWTSMTGGPGGGLYLNRVKGPDSTLTAYDVTSLRQRWEVRQRATGDDCAASCGSASYPCGESVCLSGTRSTEVFDRVTGVRKWQADWSYLEALGPGRLTGEDSTNLTRVLLDEATGRQLTDLGNDQTLFDGTDPLLRLYRTTQPFDRFAVSVVDRGTGATRPIGTIDPVAGNQAELIDGVLVHLTLSAELIVTAVG